MEINELHKEIVEFCLAVLYAELSVVCTHAHARHTQKI